MIEFQDDFIFRPYFIFVRTLKLIDRNYFDWISAQSICNQSVEFVLEFFGLRDLSTLPTLKEFSELSHEPAETEVAVASGLEVSTADRLNEQEEPG